MPTHIWRILISDCLQEFTGLSFSHCYIFQEAAFAGDEGEPVKIAVRWCRGDQQGGLRAGSEQSWGGCLGRPPHLQRLVRTLSSFVRSVCFSSGRSRDKSWVRSRLRQQIWRTSLPWGWALSMTLNPKHSLFHFVMFSVYVTRMPAHLILFFYLTEHISPGIKSF